jgi:hypothetical protein
VKTLALKILLAVLAPQRVVAALQASFILGGLGLLSYGSWLAYRPAGFIVPGALILAGGVRGALRA